MDAPDLTLLPAQARRVAEIASESPKALGLTQDGSVIFVTDGRRKWTLNAQGRDITYLRKRKKT